MSIVPVKVPLKVPPLIVGLVRVLLVHVSEPVNVPKLSPCSTVFHSDNEPVKVLVPKSILLFVSVSVVALPIIVSVAFGIVRTLSAVGSVIANVVS